MSWLLVVGLVICVITHQRCLASEQNDIRDMGNMNLDEAFKYSVQVYLDNDFDECIAGFNNVIQRYREYKSAVINCRAECRKELSHFMPLLRENIDDMNFYEKKVKETLCLLNCNQDYRDVAGVQALKRISRETEQKLMDLKPYEYLHICYYQKSRYQDAANAVFTYLVRHPKHEMSTTNLRYYLSLPDVKDTDVVNLEAEPFIKLYMDGVTAYEEGMYETAVHNFEQSLIAYLKSEDECRLYCEGPFDQGWLPEFTSSIANHFTYCLKCKRQCSQFLSNLNGNYQKDFLPTHYNYLQFAYYKLGDIKRACESVESYLVFLPADETMLNNRDYYLNLPKVQSEYFIARPEAVKYVKRQEYELKILRFIADEFKAIDARLAKKTDDAGEENDDDNTIPLENLVESYVPLGFSPSSKFVDNDNETTTKQILLKTWRRESQATVESLQKIKIIAKEQELGGKHRYLAKGLLIKSQCNSLIELAELAAIEGDGYTDNKSPHSKYETFKGLTVGRTALMVYFGLLDPKPLELFLKSSEDARAHVEKYFHLMDQQLHFSYTHLVCRAALPESPSTDQGVYSHTIHADNCLAIKKGICLHKSPAFTWRDYSAVIYLNDNFEGGEFVFAADPKAEEIQSTVQPRCGRMVAFSADGSNLHGVKGIRKGRRCALALWFTMDPRYVELERRLAHVILERVKLKGPVKLKTNITIPSKYEEILIDQFREDEALELLLTAS